MRRTAQQRAKTGKAVINAIWNSKCAETGTRIFKGERMVYDYDTKKCYAIACNTAVQFINQKQAQDIADSTRSMEQAQEDAMYERFERPYLS
jgi:hypothetical protein